VLVSGRVVANWDCSRTRRGQAAQSSDTSGPFAFDRGLPFETEAELAKEIDRGREIINDDSYVVPV
jgi:hypothetical protein